MLTRLATSIEVDASVQTWLMQIAVNLIRDAARSRRFQFWKRARASAITADDASQYLLDAGMSPEQSVSAAQQVRAIWRTLDGLSERQRTVFLLHFVEEMTAAEIEVATAIPKGAVKVHLFRAVRAIRKRLEHS
jgi:RNA polymerase sigma-70 factor, ECF subfamily